MLVLWSCIILHAGCRLRMAIWCAEVYLGIHASTDCSSICAWAQLWLFISSGAILAALMLMVVWMISVVSICVH